MSRARPADRRSPAAAAARRPWPRPSFIADLAGVRVFATGGLGGVHRGASETFDESADLRCWPRCPITVVSAGVKSILDIPATLERLETLSVTVVGYGTDRVPELLADRRPVSGSTGRSPTAPRSPTSWPRDALGRRSAILVANPLPRSSSSTRPCTTRALDAGARGGRRAGLSGKDVTPFLLQRIVELTGGRASRSTSRSPRTTSGSPPTSPWPGRPREVTRILVVGDVVDDIGVRPLGAVNAASDTDAEIRRTAGGSAANVAAWLGHLGADVRFVGRGGADGRRRGTRPRSRRTAWTRGSTADPDLPTATIVLTLDAAGDRTMFVDRAANARPSPPTTCRPTVLDGVGWLHLTGYSFFDDAVRPVVLDLLAEARRRGCGV